MLDGVWVLCLLLARSTALNYTQILESQNWYEQMLTAKQVEAVHQQRFVLLRFFFFRCVK